MADRVKTNVLFSSDNRKVVQFYNVSDGTGESAVVKIDRSALNPGTSPIRILRVWGMATGMAVNIFFDATADDLVLVVPTDQPAVFDWSNFGGLKDPQSAGYTGDVVFTTVGHTSGDTYSIVIEFGW